MWAMKDVTVKTEEVEEEKNILQQTTKMGKKKLGKRKV